MHRLGPAGRARTGYVALWNARYALARSSGLHVARIEHLLHRYGSLIGEMLDLIAADPTLGKPLAGADDYLRAEVVYAASHEGARHLDDVLARRTHISIETWDRGLLGRAGGRRADGRPDAVDGPGRSSREVEHYRARIAAERASQDAEHRPGRRRDPARRAGDRAGRAQRHAGRLTQLEFRHGPTSRAFRHPAHG